MRGKVAKKLAKFAATIGQRKKDVKRRWLNLPRDKRSLAQVDKAIADAEIMKANLAEQQRK